MDEAEPFLAYNDYETKRYQQSLYELLSSMIKTQTKGLVHIHHLVCDFLSLQIISVARLTHAIIEARPNFNWANIEVANVNIDSDFFAEDTPLSLLPLTNQDCISRVTFPVQTGYIRSICVNFDNGIIYVEDGSFIIWKVDIGRL